MSSAVSVGKSLLVAIGIYLFAYLVLRLSGLRSLVGTDPFTILLIVLFGNLIANIVDAHSPIINVIIILLYVGMTVLFQKLLVQFPSLEPLAVGRSQIVFSNGQFIKPAMMQGRTTEEEIRQAIRQKGLDDSDPVVLNQKVKRVVEE
jgi:uncharacterized membrane protein YcaP (DUF421 family)